MKKLFKRLERVKKDQELALKSSVKLKLGPRYKFGPFHLYRRILVGLPLGQDILDDIMDKGGWTPKGTEFGKHEVSWCEWRTRIKKTCPKQYYLREDFIHNVKSWFRVWKIKDLWYYYKCKFFTPWNVLHLKHLPPTWSDEDTILTHAMFAVLERYMSEQPWSIHDYKLEYPGVDNAGMTQEEWENWAKDKREFYKEINDVWNWWLKRDEREKAISDAYSRAGKSRAQSYNERYGEIENLEAQFEKEEDLALQTILKHRHSLWV